MLILVDAIVAIIREFGLYVGGAVLVVGGLVFAVRVLAVRLETAYKDQIKILVEAHAQQMKEKTEGCAREIAAATALSERGWAYAEQFKAQADRFAEKFGDTAQILKDLANDAYEDRRGRRRGEG